MAKSKYSEQDIATNLIISLKHLKSELSTFSQEASNPSLYKEVSACYQSISQLQRDVFEMMQGQSWYKMNADTQSSIQKAYKKFAKKIAK